MVIKKIFLIKNRACFYELIFSERKSPKWNYRRKKLRDGDKNLQEREVTRELFLSDSSNLTGKNGKKRQKKTVGQIEFRIHVSCHLKGPHYAKPTPNNKQKQ